jgi:hypothetical protein
MNMYPEYESQVYNTKVSAILIGTPGSKLFSNVDIVGDCRGLWFTSTGRLFGVFGDKLWESDSQGDSSAIDSVANFSTRVSMTDNGYKLVIVDGYEMYIYDLLNGGQLTKPTLPFDNPTVVRYIAQRIVATNADPAAENDPGEAPQNNKFYWSDLGPEGPLTWGGIAWASAESSADAIISLEIAHGHAWLFGDRSFEVHSISTNRLRPLNPVGGSASEIGCGARYSTAVIEDRVFWLGSSTAGTNKVYMSEGYNAKRISNHALEYQLGKYENTSDAVGWTYQQEGHVFYVLTFISADVTHVYDTTNKQWHERSSRDRNTNILRRWDPIFSTYAFGKVLVGNSRGAQIIELDLDTYLEWDGNPIVRFRQSPVYWNELKTLFYTEFQIDIETGVGLTSGQGEDPQVMLQYSDDGGATWSSERWVSAGKVGKYKTRCRWLRLGRSRERVFRIWYSEPTKFIMLSGDATVSKGVGR